MCGACVFIEINLIKRNKFIKRNNIDLDFAHLLGPINFSSDLCIRVGYPSSFSNARTSLSVRGSSFLSTTFFIYQKLLQTTPKSIGNFLQPLPTDFSKEKFNENRLICSRALKDNQKSFILLYCSTFCCHYVDSRLKRRRLKHPKRLKIMLLQIFKKLTNRPIYF